MSDKFVYQGDEFVLSQCAYCRHLDRSSPAAICAAFPALIPAGILSNDQDHRKPWIDPATGEPGDLGTALAGSILFEPADAVRPEALDRLHRHLDAVSS
jgi:hypothetical protein